MNGLDTNVLMRLLAMDEPIQARKAETFIERSCTVESPCRINRIVLCELVWVLESAYRYPRPMIAEVVDKVLRTREFSVEDADQAWWALRAYRDRGQDFADCLLARTNLAHGCEATATFDRKAGRIDGFRVLE